MAPMALLGSPALATNYYVDNAVATSGSGTSWSSAWKGFSNIVWSYLKAGDILYISGGTSSQIYYETLTVGTSGSSAGKIRITKGLDPGHNGTVIIDGQNNRSNGVYLYGRNYIDVRGLAIRNHSDAGIAVKSATAGVVIFGNHIYSGDPGGGNARGIDVRNSVGTVPVLVEYNTYTTPTFTNAQTDGIWSSGNNGVIFQNNRIVISNNSTNGHSDGIQSYTDYNIVIRNNWIEQANNAQYNNHGMWLSDTHNGGVIKVYNNVVYVPNLTGDSAVTHWAESSWNENGTIRIWNNNIVGGGRSVNLDKSPNAEVKNNIIWPSAGGYGVFMVNGNCPAANINNNLIWAPNASIAYANGGTKTWYGWRSLGYDSAGANANPLFTNLSSKQFMPQSASWAVNRGQTISEVKFDNRGTPRPQGAAYDIGAFELIP